MIIWTAKDQQMLEHLAQVMNDYISDEPDEYNEQDVDTVAKVEALASLVSKGAAITLSVATSEDSAETGEASKTMQDIIRAEMDHWVPEASQRLINRAAMVLNHTRLPIASEPDHGPNPGDHALISDWVVGMYVLRCVTCQHLFHA